MSERTKLRIAHWIAFMACAGASIGLYEVLLWAIPQLMVR
jgi:hypothetical protein